MFEGFYDAIDLLRYDVATVDDFLSFLYQSAGECHPTQQITFAGFAALTVIGKIGCDVVVQVALLQDAALLCQLLVHEKVLIGCLGGIDVHDRSTDGLFATDDA